MAPSLSPRPNLFTLTIPKTWDLTLIEEDPILNSINLEIKERFA